VPSPARLARRYSTSALIAATKRSAGTRLRTAIEKSQYVQRRAQNGMWT